MSSPTSFKHKDSSRPMSSTSPTHSTIPWCPSIDDRNIHTIPQLPFPLSLQSTTASKTSQSTPVPSNTTSSDTTSSSLPSLSTPLSTSVAPSATESRPDQRGLVRLIIQTLNNMDPAMKEEMMRQEPYSRSKFPSAPRGSRAAKNKSNKNGRLTEEYTRLREIYTPLKGPAPPSSKNRRPKRARGVGVDNRYTPSFRHLITEGETPPHIPPPSLPPQTPSMMQALSSMMISPQLTLPHRPSNSFGFKNCAQDQTLSPFLIDQGNNTHYPNHDQNMFDPHTQAFQSLDPSLISTGLFNTSMWNLPAVTMTEAISPQSLPQHADALHSPNSLSATALPEQSQIIDSNSAQPSADNFDYDQPSHEDMSAESLASFGASEGYLVFDLQGHVSRKDMDDLMIGPDGFFLGSREFDQRDLTVDVDLDDTDVICEIGDLTSFQYAWM